ncbi:MAG: TonB-dependent receptor, partial [Dehalococcoidaceae bacterium]|nr:TonB-dependent receptor [Dehalococcoidaceae bacterium]
TKTGTEGLQMQGLDASYTAILIDGFPLIGRSFGTLDLNRISLADIASIEIIKGSSSSLYGSHALAGVINVISKKQINDGSNISMSLKGASHNTLNPNLTYQFKKSAFQISTTADFYKTDGYDLIESDLLNTVNPYSNYTMRSNLRYAIHEKFLLKTYARYFNQQQINTAIYNNSILEGQSTIKEYSAGLTLKHIPHSKCFQHLELYKTNYRTDEFLNNEEEILFDENYFDHDVIQGELRAFAKFKGINTTFGIGSTQEELSRRDFSSKAKQNNLFVYGQLYATAFEKYQIVLGSRYDNYSDYTPVASNKLALGFPIKQNLHIQGSVGTGFKTPDFRQRFFDFTNSTIGYIVLGREIVSDRLEAMQNIQQVVPISELQDPLKSETSLNINIGLKYNPTNNLYFDFNFFNNKVNDLIEWQLVAKDEGIDIYSYFNVNQVETKGLEFNSTYTRRGNWEIKFGYQLLFAYDTEVKRRFKEEIMYARDQETNVSFKLNKDDYFGLFNRSRHMGNIQLNYYLNGKTDLNAMLTYRSKYALSDSNANGFLDTYDEFIDAYALLDLSISRRLKENCSIQLGANNIFGYTNPQYSSNISGRIYFIKLNMNLKTNN